MFLKNVFIKKKVENFGRNEKKDRRWEGEDRGKEKDWK